MSIFGIGTAVSTKLFRTRSPPNAESHVTPLKCQMGAYINFFLSKKKWS